MMRRERGGKRKNRKREESTIRSVRLLGVVLGRLERQEERKEKEKASEEKIKEKRREGKEQKGEGK